MYVVLPGGDRPHLVSKAGSTHSFAEFVNQRATLERLIDALGRVESEPDLKDAKAVACNPTTNSGPQRMGAPRDNADHDLVLEDSGGTRWSFEVSDVAGEKDGNGKEKKDLLSLGVTTTDADTWPTGRCLLVVSSEFADRLRRPTRHGLRFGLFHYAEVKAEGATRIFEVCKGRRRIGGLLGSSLPRGRPRSPGARQTTTASRSGRRGRESVSAREALLELC